MLKACRIIAILMFVLALAACGEEDDGILRQIEPGSTVYIDAWDEDAEKGDQALVEQKPSGLWVIPVNAPYRNASGDDFVTEVTLNDSGQFVVEDLGGIKVGKDHDNCLAEEELYAVVNDVSESNFEQDNSDNSTEEDGSGDCDRVQSKE